MRDKNLRGRIVVSRSPAAETPLGNKKMIFKFLLTFLLISSGFHLFSQKMDGVYFGHILSDRNALVVKSSGSSVTGSVYLNKTTTCNFVGAFFNPVVTGKIHLANGKEISFEGELIKNSLVLKLSSDSMQGEKQFLNKISSTERYDVDKLFIRPQDPMLFGKWETIKETDPNGVSTYEGKVVIEFDGNGIEYVQIISLPDRSKDIGASLNYNPYKRMEMRWTTDGSKLYSTMKLPQGDKSDYGYYTVKRDTLSVYATNGAITLYKKK